MSDIIKVDSHVHLYRTAEEGILEKEGYEIWEYGHKPAVHLSDSTGTVQEIVDAMQATGISKAVAVNLFSANAAREIALSQLPDKLSEQEKAKAVQEIDANVIEQLKTFNRWGCDVAQKFPQIAAFIAVDVNAMPGLESANHVRDLVENHGARGVKLHGAFQQFNMSDQRLWPAYAVCQELGVSIIGHSGMDKNGDGLAEPRAFAGVLKAFPELTVVLAHMGGGSWKQALEIAETYPNAFFDCCEIIEWTDSENGPTEIQLSQLIKDIGPQRIMMGSDFPWYDLDHTIERVMELPLLSDEEKQGILGSNAVNILRL